MVTLKVFGWPAAGTDEVGSVEVSAAPGVDVGAGICAGEAQEASAITIKERASKKRSFFIKW
jgi:hypothetical protein